MRFLTSILVLISILLPGLVFGHQKKAIKKAPPEYICQSKHYVIQDESITSLCSSLNDVFCKNIPKENRRTCQNDSDSKLSSEEEIGLIMETCFLSSMSSMAKFFIEFVPELTKSLWNGFSDYMMSDIKPANSNDPGVWSKMKGMYESINSISVDIYETLRSDPEAFISYLYDQLKQSLMPLVKNTYCLKPQIVTEKICGFVSEWLFPPVALAKALISSVKFTKAALASGVISQKILSFSKKSKGATRLTVTEYHGYLNSYRNLGYSAEEFEFLYKSKLLDKIPKKDLAAISTPLGKEQRKLLLENFVKTEEIPLQVTNKVKITEGANQIKKYEKIYSTQQNIASNYQKMANQVMEKMPKANEAQLIRLNMEFEDLIEAEIKIQKDIIETSKKIGSSNGANLAQARINELEKLTLDLTNSHR